MGPILDVSINDACSPMGMMLPLPKVGHGSIEFAFMIIIIGLRLLQIEDVRS